MASALRGGRGGLVGASIGAIDIFLLQSVLTDFNVSTYVLQIAYGAILVAAVILTAVQERGRPRRGGLTWLSRKQVAPNRQGRAHLPHPLRPCRTNGRIVIAFLIAGLLHLVERLPFPATLRPLPSGRCIVIAALLAVASIGQTLVVILGGIDLSIPFVIGFANVVAAQLYGDSWNFALVCLFVIVVAMLIGAFERLHFPAARHSSPDRHARDRHDRAGVGAALDGGVSLRVGATLRLRLRFDRRIGGAPALSLRGPASSCLRRSSCSSLPAHPTVAGSTRSAAIPAPPLWR